MVVPVIDHAFTNIFSYEERRDGVNVIWRSSGFIQVLFCEISRGNIVQLSEKKISMIYGIFQLSLHPGLFSRKELPRLFT